MVVEELKKYLQDFLVVFRLLLLEVSKLKLLIVVLHVLTVVTL